MSQLMYGETKCINNINKRWLSMYLDLGLLRGFLAIVDCGGFGAAGHKLGLSQAAVSAQIKRLEEQVGAALFERTSRRIALTDAGGALLPYARRIMHLQDAAEAALSEQQERAPIRLGISEEQADRFLPAVLPVFAQRFPQARLKLACASSPGILQQFRQGELDIVVSVRHDQDIAGQAIGLQPLVWVASADFALDTDACVPLACNPDGCVYRAAAQESLAKAGRRWRIMCTSQSPVGINAAVRSGLAVCVKAERSVPSGCRRLTAQEGFPSLPSAVIEIHRASSALTAEATVFSDLLIEVVRQSLAVAP